MDCASSGSRTRELGRDSTLAFGKAPRLAIRVHGFQPVWLSDEILSRDMAATNVSHA